MATFREFEKYVRANFKVRTESRKDMIAIGFNLPDDRSQLIFIGRGGSDKFGEVAHCVSFLGELTGKKLEKALEETANLNTGGLIKIGEGIAYRCTILLEDVDESEIQKSIFMAAVCADHLEQMFTGEDNY